MKKSVLTFLEKVLVGILFLVLCFWFIPFITKGIDVQDTCSYLTKYRYVFDKDVKVNELFYLFAEVVGGVIYHLVPSHQVLALNIASWACYTATAILIYMVFRKYMPRIPLLLTVLVGSFFGITWVHCLNWNAISMLVQTVGLLLLLKALRANNNRLFVICGVLFAANTFVRLPNILQLGLSVVIFWHYFVPEYHFAKAFQKWLWMVLGGIIGAVISLLLAIQILGFDKFSDDILMLTSVGGGEESSHGLVRIISLFYRGMLLGGVNWLKYGAVLIVLSALLVLIQKAVLSTGWKLISFVGIVGITVAFAFGTLLGLQADYINVHVFVAFGAIVLGTIGAFYYARKDILFSDLCLAVVIMEVILTIGTDTGAAYYRVYMGMPLALIVCILIRFTKELFVYKEKKYKTLSELKRIQWKNKWLIPCGIVFCTIVAGFSVAYPLAAGYHYATTFVYHDSPNPYLVKEIKAKEFAGLKTSVERAELLDRLTELLEPYKDYKLLSLGGFNVGYVITDMKPFFDSSWPDLEYLTMDRFQGQLAEGIQEGNYPVIVLGDMAQDQSGFWNKEKLKIAVELGESDLYTKLYSDKWYVVYVPKNTR